MKSWSFPSCEEQRGKVKLLPSYSTCVLIPNLYGNFVSWCLHLHDSIPVFNLSGWPELSRTTSISWARIPLRLVSSSETLLTGTHQLHIPNTLPFHGTFLLTYLASFVYLMCLYLFFSMYIPYLVPGKYKVILCIVKCY